VSDDCWRKRAASWRIAWAVSSRPALRPPAQPATVATTNIRGRSTSRSAIRSPPTTKCFFEPAKRP